MRRSWGGGGAGEELRRGWGGAGEEQAKAWAQCIQQAWKRGLGQCFREAERLGLGGGCA